MRCSPPPTTSCWNGWRARVGYGAMHLAGPAVFGSPKDRDEAIIVLRTAVELSIRHIDTAGFHGPYVTNELIREAPVAVNRMTCTSSPRSAPARRERRLAEARTPAELRRQVHENLGHLGWTWGGRRTCYGCRSSVAHLRKNVASAALVVPADAVAALAAISAIGA